MKSKLYDGRKSKGWYQVEGKAAQFLKADVIVTHDGVKHWHGAAKDSWFEHISITAGTPDGWNQ